MDGLVLRPCWCEQLSGSWHFSDGGMRIATIVEMASICRWCKCAGKSLHILPSGSEISGQIYVNMKKSEVIDWWKGN